MNINKIKINNYKSISELEIEFNPKLNVFVGANGAGKTTILDSITIALSWLINRIQRENTSGKHISESDIRKKSPYSSIETFVNVEDSMFNWYLTKTQKGESQIEKSNLTQVSDLAEYFRVKLKNENNLPVIAYYPVNRVVKDVSTEISSKESFYVLDVYDNAIGVKANFQSFFEWFRMQDDILNESLGSRTKWMIKNKKWLKRRTDKAISQLKKLTTNYDEFKYLTERIKRDDIIFEEPRYFFRELIDLLHTVEFKFKREYRAEKILHDIEYLIHKMDSLSEMRKDNLIDKQKFPTHIIERVFSQLEQLFYEVDIKENKNLVAFIWEILQFAILLSLWWMSDKGKSEIESLFKEYNPTLIRNKRIWNDILSKFLNDIERIIENDANRQDVATKNQGRELQIVTKTIENFIEGYSNIRIKRIPRPHLLVDKNEETFNLEQLSDGEKNLIALVGDIARRLSIANPHSTEPLKGDGVILIDEIDLHLHPAWQRIIIPKLTELFPNCQFFISTHSPQVLSHVMPENIFLLNNTNNILTYDKPEESYGMTVDRVVELLMNEDTRPVDTKNKIDTLFEFIERNKLENAKDILAELKQYLKTDSEIFRAEMLIRKREIKK
ncbi:MAG: AAA family ATPase [Marinifilaceae bacterium]|jgi:predicted ATP-binding protein involved in virulence|nr:AAA family ATPase [Marinifilaceae bacterium]